MTPITHHFNANDQTVVINIAEDFSRTPGARTRKNGPFSGQEFKEDFLDKYFRDPSATQKVKIILDGAAGYATSFLEEAFGGLAREYGKRVVKNKLHFVSNQNKTLVDEILSYIEAVED